MASRHIVPVDCSVCAFPHVSLLRVGDYTASSY